MCISKLLFQHASLYVFMWFFLDMSYYRLSLANGSKSEAVSQKNSKRNKNLSNLLQETINTENYATPVKMFKKIRNKLKPSSSNSSRKDEQQEARRKKDKDAKAAKALEKSQNETKEERLERQKKTREAKALQRSQNDTEKIDETREKDKEAKAAKALEESQNETDEETLERQKKAREAKALQRQEMINEHERTRGTAPVSYISFLKLFLTNHFLPNIISSFLMSY